MARNTAGFILIDAAIAFAIASAAALALMQSLRSNQALAHNALMRAQLVQIAQTQAALRSAGAPAEPPTPHIGMRLKTSYRPAHQAPGARLMRIEGAWLSQGVEKRAHIDVLLPPWSER